MNITISDPTPAPEMPMMWAVAFPETHSEGNAWGEVVSQHHIWKITCATTESKDAELCASRLLGSHLIKIDPNVPSFEPGPTEWTDNQGYLCSVTNKEGVRNVRINDGCNSILVPNTRTDIGRLIRALVTAWHAAKEGT